MLNFPFIHEKTFSYHFEQTTHDDEIEKKCDEKLLFRSNCLRWIQLLFKFFIEESFQHAQCLTVFEWWRSFCYWKAMFFLVILSVTCDFNKMQKFMRQKFEFYLKNLFVNFYEHKSFKFNLLIFPLWLHKSTVNSVTHSYKRQEVRIFRMMGDPQRRCQI